MAATSVPSSQIPPHPARLLRFAVARPSSRTPPQSARLLPMAVLLLALSSAPGAAQNPLPSADSTAASANALAA